MKYESSIINYPNYSILVVNDANFKILFPLCIDLHEEQKEFKSMTSQIPFIAQLRFVRIVVV